MIIYNGGPNLSLDEVVLFPFDDYSLPFQRGVRLQLVPSKRGQIVVPFGPSGAPDSEKIAYYGAVCTVDKELWMWYLGGGRVCLAKSTDGYHWERPNLGLIEYNGSRQNNLVDLGGAQFNVAACVVLYEPADLDPQRRFKMVFETHRRNPSDRRPSGRAEFNVAVSPDGLNWTETSVEPHYLSCEMGGLIKFNGCYYISSQSGGGHFPRGRNLETFVSYDFKKWVEADCMGLNRQNIPPRPMVDGSHAGEQVHLGAGLWNRENVIIGIYGQWHGHPTNDRKLVSMDLGLVVSNDALHYREPIPDFRLIPAAENSGDRLFPCLMQGQGFANIGGETLFWYAPWGGCNGIRVANWPQDRLGYFETFLGSKMGSLQESHFISAPLDLENKPAQVYINVDGLSAHAEVSVEILTEKFEAIPGFARDICIGPKASGLRQLVTWQDHETLNHVIGRVRIRVNFGGLRPEDVKIYAIYVEGCK